MNAQASSQPASHTVYTVHPEPDESAPGDSSQEGQADSDLPADPEGWEDGSVPADSGEEAVTGSEQPADPEGWDDDFPLDNMDVAQVGACAAHALCDPGRVARSWASGAFLFFLSCCVCSAVSGVTLKTDVNVTQVDACRAL